MPFSNDDKLALAFLHRTHTGARQLIIRDVGIERREISSDAVTIDMEDEGTNRVIPILSVADGRSGGLLLCGGRDLLFFDSNQEVESPVRTRRMSSAVQRRPDARIDWTCSDITGYVPSRLLCML